MGHFVLSDWSLKSNKHKIMTQYLFIVIKEIGWKLDLPEG